MVSAAETLMAPETEEDEQAEPPVEAVPKLGRAAVMYAEPRVGIDGVSMFGACGSCQSYVAEAAMLGAVIGDRCAKFGSGMRISDDDHCSLYEPFGAGMPCEALTMFYAMELRKGYAGISPWAVGYKSKTCVQCNTCRFYDAEPSECEAMEYLNEKSGNLFEMATEVNNHGWCSMWTAPDPMGDPVGY